MAVIALGDQLAIDTRLGDRAFDRLVGLIVNLYLVAAADDPVAFFEIDDPLGQRGKGKRVRAKIGLPLPNPYDRSEEHTSELQSLMRISYAVFCLEKKKQKTIHTNIYNTLINYTNNSQIKRTTHHNNHD